MGSLPQSPAFAKLCDCLAHSVYKTQDLVREKKARR